MRIPDEPDKDDEWLPGMNSEADERETNSTNTQPGVRSSMTRKYNHVNRKKAEAKGSANRRKEWESKLSTMTESKLRRTVCCKSLRCCQTVDYMFLLTRAKDIISTPVHSRRSILELMLNSKNEFTFNGKNVCTVFLRKAFGFGSDLIADVARGSSGDNDIDGSTSDGEPRRIIAKPPRAALKDSIVSFLIRLSEDCSDKMPDKDELHLPFNQKKDVYEVFLNEFKVLYPDITPPQKPYFSRIWKLHCNNIKVRKSSRFTICETCDKLKRALHEAVKRKELTVDIKRQINDHRDFVKYERMAYYLKRDRARQQPDLFCSCIVDGADQSAHGLPHFTTSTKNQRGISMKVKLIGLLEHNIPNILNLFTMTEEHQTGANHVIEAVHRFINLRRLKGPLPPTLFVQVDNCSRENKNRYLMSYFEFLVRQGVFSTVEVGFLPVGHTHEDIDQAFSKTSERLKLNNAITLDDLHEQLSFCYGEEAKVQQLRRLVNWSGLCEQTNCLRKIDNITQFRYFRIRRIGKTNAVDSFSGLYYSEWHVKHKWSDEWKKLFNNCRGDNPEGALKFCPDLSLTPPLEIECPDGCEKVTKRIQSEAGRIGSSTKMANLYALRDFVFAARRDEFHWNLENVVELEHCRSMKQKKDDTRDLDEAEDISGIDESVMETFDFEDENETGENDEIEKEIMQPSTKVDYEIDSFVVVRVKASEERKKHRLESPNWAVGRVLKILRNDGEDFARKLSIQWYDDSAGKRTEHTKIDSHFYPCYKKLDKQDQKRRKTNKTVPTRSELREKWTDEVDTDSVIISFEQLTKKNTLPRNVQVKLDDF